MTIAFNQSLTRYSSNKSLTFTSSLLTWGPYTSPEQTAGRAEQHLDEFCVDPQCMASDHPGSSQSPPSRALAKTTTDIILHVYTQMPSLPYSGNRT